MKKVILLVAFFCVVAACKKDYTCTCTYMDGGETKMDISDFKKVKKKEADDTCAELETTLKVSLPDVSCSLD